MLKKVLKDKMALVCLIILALIILMGIFAPFVSTYNPLEGLTIWDVIRLQGLFMV